MTVSLNLEKFTVEVYEQLKLYFPGTDDLEVIHGDPGTGTPLGYFPLGEAPLGTGEEETPPDERGSEWHGLIFLNAIGRMMQVLEDLARDDEDGNPGWSILLDIDRAPTFGLPWFGQFIGVRTDGKQIYGLRQRIRSVDGFNVASPAAVEAATKFWLTDTKTAFMNPRTGGNAYRWRIVTLASETPYPDLVYEELIKQKPAGILLEYYVVDGWDYAALSASYDDYPDYAAITASFVDYAALEADTPS